VEAKSFLKTMQQKMKGFALVCPVQDVFPKDQEANEMQLIRDFKEKELDFFREEMLTYMVFLADSIIDKVKGSVPSSDLEFYSKYVAEEFLDKYDDVRAAQPERLARIEEAHFTLLFLFDLL
jgi:hypothetical protein